MFTKMINMDKASFAPSVYSPEAKTYIGADKENIIEYFPKALIRSYPFNIFVIH